MSDKILSVSRRIARIGNIVLTSVALFPRDKIVINTKHTMDGKQIILDFPAFLRLDLPYQSGISHNVRSITLNYIGRVQLIAAMRRMIQILRSGEVFYNDPEMGLVITQNTDDRGASKWIVYERIGDSSIAFSPTVIEEDEIQYEGVVVIVNVPNNSTTLSVTEFTVLAESVKDTNIWLESQLLFLTALNLSSAPSKSKAETIPDTHAKLMELESKALRKAEGCNEECSKNQLGEKPD